MVARSGAAQVEVPTQQGRKSSGSHYAGAGRCLTREKSNNCLTLLRIDPMKVTNKPASSSSAQWPVRGTASLTQFFSTPYLSAGNRKSDGGPRAHSDRPQFNCILSRHLASNRHARAHSSTRYL